MSAPSKAERIKALRLAGVSKHRAEKGDLEAVRIDAARSFARRKYSSVMALYMSEGLVTREQYDAAYRLLTDWSQSGYQPWGSGQEERISAPGPRSPGCGPKSAEYSEAMRKLPPLEQTMVYHVVLSDLPVASAAADTMSSKALWAVLRRGLDVLVRHYGYGP